MSYRRCPSCRNWAKCTGYDYFEPFEIEKNFCKYQIYFIFIHWATFEDGEYPVDHRNSGYVGGASNHKYGTKYLTPKDIQGELNRRITATGEDGETLKHEAIKLKTPLDQLARAAKNALLYCCDEEMKRMEYGKWRSQKKWRQ